MQRGLNKKGKFSFLFFISSSSFTQSDTRANNPTGRRNDSGETRMSQEQGS
jgi:hypothetical protein